RVVEREDLGGRQRRLRGRVTVGLQVGGAERRRQRRVHQELQARVVVAGAVETRLHVREGGAARGQVHRDLGQLEVGVRVHRPRDGNQELPALERDGRRPAVAEAGRQVERVEGRVRGQWQLQHEVAHVVEGRAAPDVGAQVGRRRLEGDREVAALEDGR